MKIAIAILEAEKARAALELSEFRKNQALSRNTHEDPYAEKQINKLTELSDELQAAITKLQQSN